jgi:DNA-binding transcriptional regulator LsrR (DeoR family)
MGVGNYPPERLSRLLELAEMLCRHRMSLSEAAKSMNISVASASRLKKDAEKLGIICTIYCPPPNLALEAELGSVLSKYGFRTVLVSQRSVAQRAARYFEQTAQANDIVMLDGGHTVKDFVSSLSEACPSDLTIMPICADPPSYEISAYELMVIMAARCSEQHSGWYASAASTCDVSNMTRCQ